MVNPQMVWQSPQLPTLPAVAVRLIELTRTPDTDVADIVELIGTDPALAAKILKAANSSFFALATKVTSVNRAVLVLGTTSVTALALGFSLADASVSRGPLGEAYDAYWLQSTVQASAAESLAHTCRCGQAEDLFLAGLLIDLGRLAMLRTIPGEYLPVIARSREEARPLQEVETEALGFSHVEIGIELASRWKLPPTLLDALRLHHASLEELGGWSNAESRATVQTTALAAAVGEYFCGTARGLALERLKSLSQALFGMSKEALDEFLQNLRPRIDETAELFAVDTQNLPSPGELLEQANLQLANLTLLAQAETTQANARKEAMEHEARELAERNERLQQMTTQDALTGVYNRRFFDETLAHEIDHAARMGQPLGVIFLDADRFKQLNDTWGHAFGDTVLVQIAQVVRRATRSADVLARYGGEEFVVLVKQPTEKGFAKVSERIRASVEALVLTIDGVRVPVTVSVGAAMAIPQRGNPSAGAQLVQAADSAMYEAKHAGRNQVRITSLMSVFDRNLLEAVNRSRFSRWLVARGVVDVAAAGKALLESHTERIRVGEIARHLGILDASQTARVVTTQQQTGRRFGETALELGMLTADQLALLLAWQAENPGTFAQSLVAWNLIEAPQVEQLLRVYEAEMGLACTLPPARPAAETALLETQLAGSIK